MAMMFKTFRIGPVPRFERIVPKAHSHGFYRPCQLIELSFRAVQVTSLKKSTDSFCLNLNDALTERLKLQLSALIETTLRERLRCKV